MPQRRHFLKTAAFGALAAGLGGVLPGARAAVAKAQAKAGVGPLPHGAARVISTWDFGVAANQAAWQVLSRGGAALDAVEAGVRVPEADPDNHTVGLGGYPDRDGRVTLDACIMDHTGGCGSVAALEDIVHAISVARRVMEKTPHVMLVGDGALQFALAQGFERTKLLTPESEQAWKEWLKTSHYAPEANIENRAYRRGTLPGGKDNHDTIGMLALDAHGNLSGACTTSGMAWKMHGRVGDSPIIGAGLYVDNEVGGATSTGVGEEVIRNVGSFAVVEMMRQGKSPAEACREVVMRIVRRKPELTRDLQVGFLAMNKRGEVGAFAIQPGFSYAVCDAQRQDLLLPGQSHFAAPAA
ncbi:N(4)-(beta-N-acetylglucosaminyl)-L-asparaginase [Xanthomonas sontii]|uniref:N(4)-(Beta-N-acetylglucosaminyl)-L-asparaginase n=1 Tax=Xanthomonas sontii TaxID=2650745 RepID=A0A6N7QCN0_9XANT|nr:N(4)-(beta-N-acetylglucosaminyl)-L-asparaginase [Xanthomonas sontii]MRG99984.1 N(4)-(beta-N-acetylglucosaminyl)-L-asparaginase [Xanthomonas sontii]MRH74317.1 N(4)-(beta-N-acetylglucosaminyl)-L-asparaginase [Xanthomonas sontii]